MLHPVDRRAKIEEVASRAGANGEVELLLVTDGGQ